MARPWKSMMRKALRLIAASGFAAALGLALAGTAAGATFAATAIEYGLIAALIS
jgi:hypothetical protein